MGGDALEPKWIYIYIYIIYIYPTSPLGDSGLEIVSIKSPLSLPSPRAFDPAGLGVVQVYIGFSKPYRMPSESFQKCNANEVLMFVSPFVRGRPEIKTSASHHMGGRGSGSRG